MERRVESPFNLKYPSCVYKEDKAATNKKRKDVTWGRGITSNLPTVLLKLNVKKKPNSTHDNNPHSPSISPVSKIDNTSKKPRFISSPLLCSPSIRAIRYPTKISSVRLRVRLSSAPARPTAAGLGLTSRFHLLNQAF